MDVSTAYKEFLVQFLVENEEKSQAEVLTLLPKVFEPWVAMEKSLKERGQDLAFPLAEEDWWLIGRTYRAWLDEWCVSHDGTPSYYFWPFTMFVTENVTLIWDQCDLEEGESMKVVLYHHSEERHAMWQLGSHPAAPLVFSNVALARRFKEKAIPDTDWGDEWEPLAVDDGQMIRMCRPHCGYYLQAEPNRFAWVPMSLASLN